MKISEAPSIEVKQSLLRLLAKTEREIAMREKAIKETDAAARVRGYNVGESYSVECWERQNSSSEEWVKKPSRILKIP